MEIWSLILKALSSQSATDILAAAGIYVVTPLATHIHLQFLKFDRRERGLPKLGDWTQRGLAFVMCTGAGIFIGWRLAGWPLNDAIDHGTAVGLGYPFFMWMYMSWLKKNRPEAYQKLVAPRRRKDERGANDTWNGV